MHTAVCIRIAHYNAADTIPITCKIKFHLHLLILVVQWMPKYSGNTLANLPIYAATSFTHV